MLSMEYAENNLRFESKYNGIDAHEGSEMIGRHKDQEVGEKINTRNHQDVFQKTAQFFSEYRNSHKWPS